MRVQNGESVVWARRWASDYYRKHKNDPEHQGHHPSHLASEAIRLAGEKYGIGFGSEGFQVDDNESITYLNMGDTYDYTVLFDSRTERFFTGCWGDIVEREGVE